MSEMVRLNAAIRDETIKNLLARKYVKQQIELDEAREALDKAKEDLLPMAYETVFTKDQIKKIESLPQGWLPKSKGVMVRIVDPKDEQNFTDEMIYWGNPYTSDVNDLRPVPHKFNANRTFAAIIPKDHPYIVERERVKEMDREYVDRLRDLEQSKKASVAKVRHIMDSVTTIKRLMEVWPEIQEFLPELHSGKNGGVPAHLIADLNAEFGIG